MVVVNVLFPVLLPGSLSAEEEMIQELSVSILNP